MHTTTRKSFFQKASFLFITLFFSYSYAQITVSDSGPGNYTFLVPCDVTSITIEAWGAGGAGGGGITNKFGGQGGGAGAYASITTAVTGGQEITYTVGAAGTGSTGDGTNGGNTTISLGTLVLDGGNGGIQNGTSNPANGGTGTGTGWTIISGNDGANGGGTTGGDGADGETFAGSGGNGNSGGNGFNATQYGAGGGGGEQGGGSTWSGGNGSDGRVAITYTTAYQFYCTTFYDTFVLPITNVTFAGINNTTTEVTGGSSHEAFCSPTATVTQGTSPTITVEGNTDGAFTDYYSVYADWNQDGTFAAGERTDIGTITNSTGIDGATASIAVNVPAGATPGLTYMRVMKSDSAYPTNPCSLTYDFGQTEDYLVNVIMPVCADPVDQASGLILTPVSTVINGTFTAAVSAPDSYLVVMNETGTPPAGFPLDGTPYTIGQALAGGNTVIDIDSDTSFSASILNPSTLYYFFVFSYNDATCTGGPLYNTITPLTGSATTGTISYCTPSNNYSGTENYIENVQFIGTLNDVSNLGTGFTTPGYADYTGLANSYQQQGEGMNVYVEGNTRGHFKTWIDWNKDGLFDQTTEVVYDSGTTSTASTTFGYTVPLAQALGTYTMRIRYYTAYNTSFSFGHPDYENHTPDFDSCQILDAYSDPSAPGTIFEYGEVEDYTFDVVSRCDAQITAISNGEACAANSTVDISVTGAGNVTSYHWYADEIGGAELAETFTGTWTTPSIATTTVYWVAADNGTCEAYERERVIAFLNAPATLTFTPSSPYICGENNPPIQIAAASTTQIGYLIDEDFEGGLGTFTENNITSNGAGPDAISTWQSETSVFVPSEYVWFPAISSGFGTNNFVMSNADSGGNPTENELMSATVDASTYVNLTLELDMYFSRYNLGVPENVNIEVSTDGGATWTIEANITDDVGYGTNFDHLTYNLDTYAGQANLRVRVYYYSEWGDGVAVDNIQLYGNNTINPLVSWTNPGGVLIYEDAGAVTLYTPGDLRNVVYIVPTAAELQSSSTWSFTASVTLANGCAATGTVVLQNRTKYFMGTTNDWNDPTNWKPVGVPTSLNCVIIPDTYSANIAGGIDGDAYNLNVQNGGVLDIQPTGTVTVQNFVDVDATGTFTIESEGSLIQVQDQGHVDYVANTGNINMKRTANIRKLDYVYWSTPVANFPVASISPTTSTSLIWEWNPTVALGYAGDFGIWQNTTENMIDAKGYIVRGPSAFTTAFQNYTATFSGVPNNGTVTRAITRSTYTSATDYAGPTALLVNKDDDNWNLIGNPYPSAISADDFITANTDIEGAVHIWTHGTAPSSAIADPFYQDFVANYTVADYITYNFTGPSTGASTTWSGNIASGQGFFVLMEDTGATSEVVTFDNTMRDRGHGNDEFYRTANPTASTTVTNSNEKHRIWLDLIAPNNQNNRILVGYVTGATDGKDRLFDATNINKSNFNLYSKVDEHKLLIQGRPVPFVDTDKVNLEAILPSNGEYKFAINSLDGLFEDETQGIYLEDKELDIIHDLRHSPYTFNANSGVQENRFVLRYTDGNKLLDIEDVITNNELSIFTANNQVTALSNTSNIQSFIMYDINGRLLANNRNLNTTEHSINTNNYSTGTYLVTIELKDGRTLTKKVVF